MRLRSYLKGARRARKRFMLPRFRFPQIVFVFLMVALVIGLASCKFTVGLDTVVKEDGSGTFGFRLAADKELLDLVSSQGGPKDIFADFGKQFPEGWKVEQGTDPDGSKWVRAWMSYGSLDELKSVLARGGEGPFGQLEGSSIEIDQSSSLFALKTRYRGKIDLGKVLNTVSESFGGQAPPEMLASIIQFENRVTLPGRITSHNAAEVKGSTAIWWPSAAGTIEMSAQSTALRWGVVVGFIAGGLIVIGVLVALIVLVMKKRKGAVAVVASVPEVQPAQTGDQVLGEQDHEQADS